MSESVASPEQRAAVLKVPPHSHEAEQSVLGGLMLNDDAWFDVVETVTAADFYRAQFGVLPGSVRAQHAHRIHARGSPGR